MCKDGLPILFVFVIFVNIQSFRATFYNQVQSFQRRNLKQEYHFDFIDV